MRSRIVIAVLAAALVGFGIFGVMAFRAVTVERADASDALRRFEAARSAAGAGEPLLVLDEAGRVVRQRAAPPAAPGEITRLRVLAYRAGEERLVTVDAAWWFFKIKGPAAQYVLAGTGLDLDALAITAADLERYGPALVIDHARADGSRLLVWTE